MPDTILLIRGDSLGQMPSQPTQNGNVGQPDHEMVCKDVMGVATSNDIIRMVGYQNVPSSSTAFANGQFWRIQTWQGQANPTAEDLANDSNWKTIYDNVVPKPDLAGNLGMTKDSVVFEVQGMGRDPHDVYPNANGWDTRHLILKTGKVFPDTPGTTVVVTPPEGPFEFDKLTPPLLCFVAGTMIDTPTGPRRVEDLRAGDLVLTRDHGVQPVRWAASRVLDAIDLAINARMRPVRIAAGSLGDAIPARDLLVSPQHRMLVRSKIGQKMTGALEVLVPAKDLLDLAGVETAADLDQVTYVHVMFDRHEVITANGAQSESFFPGEQALKAVDKGALDELFALFPELADAQGAYAPARTFVKGQQARKLVQRHTQNNRSMVA